MVNDTWLIKGSYWVEAGVIIGNFAGHQNGTYTSPVLFWGDKRPGYGFVAHLGGVYSVNTYVSVAIGLNAAGNAWDVRIGTLAGTSVGNFAPPALRVDSGLESTYVDARTFGSSSSLKYRTLQDALIDDWRGAVASVNDASVGLNGDPKSYFQTNQQGGC